MNVNVCLEGYQVLFLEESRTHRELFDMWLREVSTQFASTPADFYAHFDSTVAVVCLSRSVLDDRPEEVRNHVLARNPFCQFVLITPRSQKTPTMHPYDVGLRRPVCKDDLWTTVRKRLTYGVYSSLLHEFYSLNGRLNSLRRANSAEELDSDGILRRYDERLREIKPQLKRLQIELDDEDVREIWQSIARHKEYLTEPNPNVDSDGTSKHHPDECPACDLPWGRDHGNELGIGFISLGAGVWKCSRCDEIVHGLDGSRQRVV